MNKLFKLSKTLHKYLGLILFLFLAWMSLSGILLNHPDWISGLSVPKWMVPKHYIYEDWSRSALVDAVFPNSKICYAAGREGVWFSIDSGRTFTSLNKNGFSDSRHYRRTNDILMLGDSADYKLLAGTYGGIQLFDPNSQKWSKIELELEFEKVIKFLEDDEYIYAATDSKIYRSDKDKLSFVDLKIVSNIDESELTMTEVFFEIHSGKAWGLPGRLIFDLVGLILFFLSISGIIIWYLPKQAKIKLKTKVGFNPIKSLKTSKWFFKYHLKLGIWSSIALILLAFTGFFMRPPFIVVITDMTLLEKYYPGFSHDDPFYHKIRNVMLDSEANLIIIDATNGRWKGKAEKNAEYSKEESPLPIFVMGATVFEKHKGRQLIGSFNGMYSVCDSDGRVTDIIEGKKFDEIDPVMPGKYMITGYFTTPENDTIFTTHQHGIHTLNDSKRRGRFIMPDEMLADYHMPLWNYMFELHNARIFKSMIGGIYILLIPLGSLLALILFITGVYDWFKR